MYGSVCRCSNSDVFFTVRIIFLSSGENPLFRSSGKSRFCSRIIIFREFVGFIFPFNSNRVAWLLLLSSRRSFTRYTTPLPLLRS